MSAGAAKANHLCPRLCSSIYAFTENRKPLVQALKRPEAGRRRGASRRLKAPPAGGGRGIAQGIADSASPSRHSGSNEPLSRFDSAPALLYKVPLTVPVQAGAGKACPLRMGSCPASCLACCRSQISASQPERTRPAARAQPAIAPLFSRAPRHLRTPHSPHPTHGTSRSQPCSAFPFPNGTPAAT